MEGESGVIRSIIAELHCLDIQGDQMEGESCVARSIICENLSMYFQGDQMEGESMMLLEVWSMSFIFG